MLAFLLAFCKGQEGLWDCLKPTPAGTDRKLNRKQMEWTFWRSPRWGEVTAQVLSDSQLSG